MAAEFSSVHFKKFLIAKSQTCPFSLAWANQSWTGIWHGAPKIHADANRTYPGPRRRRLRTSTGRCKAFEDPRYQCASMASRSSSFLPRTTSPTPAPDFTDHWRELAHQGRASLASISSRSPTATRPQASIATTAPCSMPFDAVTPLTPHDYLEDRPKDFCRLARHDACKTRNFGPARRPRSQRSRLAAACKIRYYVRGRGAAKALHDLPDAPRFLPLRPPRLGQHATLRVIAWRDLRKRHARAVCQEYVTQGGRSRAEPARRRKRSSSSKPGTSGPKGNYLEPDLT